MNPIDLAKQHGATELVDAMTGPQVRTALKSFLAAVARFDERGNVEAFRNDLKRATEQCEHFGRGDVLGVAA